MNTLDTVIVDVLESCHRQAVLAGAANGRRLFATLAERVASCDAGTMLMLDFSGIEVATASFLRESVMAIRDFGVARTPAVWPVMANANSKVLEELETLLVPKADALWTAAYSPEGLLRHARLVGALDPIHSRTLELVRLHKQVDARRLKEQADSDGVGLTAWHNRLTTLARRGLVREVPDGKARSYRPLMEVP